MRDLVPLAVTVQELIPRPNRGTWLDGFVAHGLDAVEAIGLQGDRAHALRAQCRSLGLVAPNGAPVRERMAQFVIVMDLLEAIPIRPPTPPTPERLVFTVPPVAQTLITPSTRLDVLVHDVIACALSTLHIGGPFWNDLGWDRLETVLVPALETRGVSATFYVHPHKPQDRAVIDARLEELEGIGHVTKRWWAGGYPSLMHAKFVVADSGRGYFGSANLTSLGFGQHLEMGVALQPAQSQSLLTLLDALEQAGLFKDAPA